MLIFLDFRAQALHFGVENYEKQHKEGTCKVLGRSVVFSAFYADFCFCSKSVIITTLTLLCSTYLMMLKISQLDKISVVTADRCNDMKYLWG